MFAGHDAVSSVDQRTRFGTLCPHLWPHPIAFDLRATVESCPIGVRGASEERTEASSSPSRVGTNSWGQTAPKPRALASRGPAPHAVVVVARRRERGRQTLG